MREWKIACTFAAVLKEQLPIGFSETVTYTIWKLSLVQRIGKAVKVTAALDNLFGYKPRYYYLNSPITDGVNLQVGVSIDIDKIKF